MATTVAPFAVKQTPGYVSLVALLALLVGAIYLIAYLLRLGWIADYFSRAVLVSYIHGVVVVLIVGQLGKIFGVSIEQESPPDQLREFLGELDQISWATFAVAGVSIVALLVIKYGVPKVPGALVVLVGGIVASAVFDLASHGVRVVGDIAAGLPHLRLPDFGWGDVTDLLPGALGIFVVGFADGVLNGRAFAGRHNQRIDANQELLRARDVHFVVARLEDHAQHRFDATGLTDLIGPANFHPAVEAAVRACVAADHLRAGGYEPGSTRLSPEGRSRRGSGLCSPA